MVGMTLPISTNMNLIETAHVFCTSLVGVIKLFPGLGLLLFILFVVQVFCGVFAFKACNKKQKRTHVWLAGFILAEMCLMIVSIYIGVLGVIGH